MTADLCGVAKAPCKSCPYRRDVPSGVWAAQEYAKLPGYDGDMLDQLAAGATALFLCHQQDGNLCAGWLHTHGENGLLALRMHGGEVKPEIWDYASPVPCFASGSEAAEHGLADINAPGKNAKLIVERLSRKLAL